LFNEFPESLRNGLEEQVAMRATVAVVEKLEAIHIHDQHRPTLVSACRACDHLLHPVREEVAVGKSRKSIVICEIFDLRLVTLAFGYVARHAVDPNNVPRRVAHRRCAVL